MTPSGKHDGFQTRPHALLLPGVSLLPERPSGSVHARVRRLQAIDREEARLDRPHRPATRRDPELLPVSRAAELLSRSACRPRIESPTTPQAASSDGGMRDRFERCGHRPTATFCGAHNFRDIGHKRHNINWTAVLQYLTLAHAANIESSEVASLDKCGSDRVDASLAEN